MPTTWWRIYTRVWNVMFHAQILDRSSHSSETCLSFLLTHPVWNFPLISVWVRESVCMHSLICPPLVFGLIGLLWVQSRCANISVDSLVSLAFPFVSHSRSFYFTFCSLHFAIRVQRQWSVYRNDFHWKFSRSRVSLSVHEIGGSIIETCICACLSGSFVSSARETILYLSFVSSWIIFLFFFLRIIDTASDCEQTDMYMYVVILHQSAITVFHALIATFLTIARMAVSWNVHDSGSPHFHIHFTLNMFDRCTKIYRQK